MVGMRCWSNMLSQLANPAELGTAAGPLKIGSCRTGLGQPFPLQGSPNTAATEHGREGLNGDGGDAICFKSIYQEYGRRVGEDNREHPVPEDFGTYRGPTFFRQIRAY